ncbi:MAG: preprotein translocase subunit SecA, partial [Elusimicrobia bacterium CG_4_8_14_3_um_filter_50_9]
EPTDDEEIKRAREIYKKLYTEAKEVTDKEHGKVLEAGGLHVLGSERHESRRVDNQLIGRCARQGDPGSAQFFISLEDELMRLFGGDRIKPLMERIGLEDGEVIEHPFINAAVSNAQKKIEAMHFDMRKQLLDFDNVLSKQRDIIYSLRNDILEGEGIPEETLSWFEDVIDSRMAEYLSDAKSFKWNTVGYSEWLKRAVDRDTGLSHEVMTRMAPGQIGKKTAEVIQQAWNERLAQLGEKEFGAMIRFIAIRVIDQYWKEHLLNLDKMREGIGLRGYAQKDPVVEYKRESLAMFEGMLDSVKKETMEFIFHMQVSINPPGRRRSAPGRPSGISSGAESEKGAGSGKKRKIMPNEPCPCGSGKKYKKCCGKIV